MTWNDQPPEFFRAYHGAYRESHREKIRKRNKLWMRRWRELLKVEQLRKQIIKELKQKPK